MLAKLVFHDNVFGLLLELGQKCVSRLQRYSRNEKTYNKIIDELENSTVLCDSVPLELTGPILGRYLLGEGQPPNEQRSPGPT